jgi:anhydro-N-acetylmuramic acid kinase
MQDTGYFIGVISGTSVDGIDCALIRIDEGQPKLIATHSGQIPGPLREKILALCTGESISLSRLGETDVEVAKAFAASINSLIKSNGLSHEQIIAIGSHGQTVYHQPEGDNPFSLQIGDPNTISELTGITTVADFRRRDMAAGGQGAPLAPLFHQHYFFHPEKVRCVINIGGMSNITWINDDQADTPHGYDTGPGNVLMDYWINTHLGKSYDESGQWALSGKVNETLLQKMLAEPYFTRPAPKSTGRELFNANWLHHQLVNIAPDQAENVQRTLLELTAITIADAVSNKTHMAAPQIVDEVIICGGGAHNKALINRIQELAASSNVAGSDSFGMAPDWVEAVTFAWLASKTLLRQSVSTQILTGSRHPVILGGVYYT